MNKQSQRHFPLGSLAGLALPSAQRRELNKQHRHCFSPPLASSPGRSGKNISTRPSGPAHSTKPRTKRCFQLAADIGRMAGWPICPVLALRLSGNSKKRIGSVCTRQTNVRKPRLNGVHLCHSDAIPLAQTARARARAQLASSEVAHKPPVSVCVVECRVCTRVCRVIARLRSVLMLLRHRRHRGHRCGRRRCRSRGLRHRGEGRRRARPRSRRARV